MARARITVEVLDQDNNVLDVATDVFEMDEDMRVYGDINNQTNTVDGVGGRPKNRQSPD